MTLHKTICDNLYIQMTDRGRGGGRKPSRGRGQGGVRRASSESMLPTQRTRLPTVQEEPTPTVVRESTPNNPISQDTPSTEEGSLTPQYPPPLPPLESGDSSDERVWLSLKGKE